MIETTSRTRDVTIRTFADKEREREMGADNTHILRVRHHSLMGLPNRPCAKIL
jgi:hypothetical protein